MKFFLKNANKISYQVKLPFELHNKHMASQKYFIT